MFENVATIVIHVSADEVFRFVANEETYPQWAMGAYVTNVSARSFGDGTLIQHRGQLLVRVSHVQVNQGFETESIHMRFPTKFLVKHTHGTIQLEPVGQGTQVMLKEQVDLRPFLKLFEPLIARKAHQNSQTTLEQLKKLLEQKNG